MDLRPYSWRQLSSIAGSARERSRLGGGAKNFDHSSIGPMHGPSTLLKGATSTHDTGTTSCLNKLNNHSIPGYLGTLGVSRSASPYQPN